MKAEQNKRVPCKLQGCYSATEAISENLAFILQSSLHENQPTMAYVEAAIPIPDSGRRWIPYVYYSNHKPEVIRQKQGHSVDWIVF